MKKFIIFFLAYIAFASSFAQNIGIGTNAPHASAMLDVTSNNKGLLVPRVAMANRPASPATGLLIYQTDNTPGFYFYNGSAWQMLGGGSGFSLPYTGSTAGNALNITSTGGIGIAGASSAATGSWYGGQFTSASTAGSGVYGAATAATGTTYGGQFATLSTSGRGVYGGATAATGATYGGYFLSQSASGNGVYGLANAATGLTRGGHFVSNSTGGTGVYGLATSSTGDAQGGEFISNSSGGRGVYGEATSFTGTTEGGRFISNSTSGTGVLGFASSTTGATYGVRGQTSSSQGKGVSGIATSTTGSTEGVSGESYSPIGSGVYGINYALTGNASGVLAASASSSGSAIFADAYSLTGQTYGVQGRSSSNLGTGVAGLAMANSGLNYGVRGASFSIDGRGVSGEAYSNSGITYGTTGGSNSQDGFGGFFYNGNAAGVALKTTTGQVEFDALAGTGTRMVVANAAGRLSTQAIAGGQWVTNGNDIYNGNSGNVGIGTTTPGAKLDVFHNADIWHSFIGGSTGRLQFAGQNVNGAVVQSWNPTTNQARDLYFQRDGGNVGIGTNNATSKLDIVENNPASVLPSVKITVNNSDNAIRVYKSGADGNGIYVNNIVETGNKAGIISITRSNTGRSTGVVGIAGNDGSGLHHALTVDMVGVEGLNDNASSGYGVIGRTKAPSGAGVVASYSGVGTGNALQIENGFIKVAGTTRTAFTVTGTGGNTSGHILYLNYTNAASSDIVIVTHNYSPNGVATDYHNAPVGVYWAGGTWAIFSENTTTPMLGKSFNVIVIKQ